jgi:TPR repeat protein
MENLSIDELFDKATKYMEEGKKQEAFNYLKVAADLGHIPTAHNLAGSYYKGLFYSNGIGCTLNYEMSIKYFNMAASTGHPEAIKNLTNLYNTVT